MTSARLPLVSVHPLWSLARTTGVVLTLVLLYALVRWPAPALHVLWDMVIPLLPAVFLVNPMLWRNVCPLATLNDVVGRRTAAALGARALTAAWVVGIVLLAVMVPARRFLFNEHGTVLAITIGVVAALALGAGFVTSRRSGFCNSLCPVLPVEKLYGQSPLLAVGSARCADCNRCTTSACIDLAGRRSAVQSTASRRDAQWLPSPFGLFACAFPGFVIGYFTTQNGAIDTAAGTYAWVAGWTATSLAVLSALAVLTQLRGVLALIVLGGLSAGSYYWFAAPKLVEAYGGGSALGLALRVVALAFVTFWTWRAVRRERS